MSAIHLMVLQVSAESLNVTMMEGEHKVLPGRTWVTLGNQSDEVKIEWTHRGDPPAVGSQWVLTPVVEQ